MDNATHLGRDFDSWDLGQPLAPTRTQHAGAEETSIRRVKITSQILQTNPVHQRCVLTMSLWYLHQRAAHFLSMPRLPTSCATSAFFFGHLFSDPKNRGRVPGFNKNLPLFKVSLMFFHLHQPKHPTPHPRS